MGELLYVLAVLVVSFVFSAIGIAPRRKPIVRQHGAPNVIPFANDHENLVKRASRGRA